MDQLVERIERLERENRRLRRAGGAVAVVLAVVTLGGAYTASERFRTIEAERFVLRDREGRVRAMLVVNSTGKAVLGFADTAGTYHLSMGVLPGGAPTLDAFDLPDRRRLGLGI